MHRMYKTRAYIGPNAEQTAERDGHWFKAVAGVRRSIDWCIERGVAVRTKALGESVDQAGAFLVPQSFQAAIIRVLEVQSSFQQAAELRVSTSDEAIRPRRTGGVTATWLSENQSLPESSFTLDLVSAVAEKLGVLVRSSTELFYEDSASDLAAFLAAEFGFAISGAIDQAGWSGTGTSADGGSVGVFTRLQSGSFKGAVAAASGHKQLSLIDGSDLAAVVAATNASALPNARWFCSSSVYGSVFVRLANTSGASLVASNGPNGIVASWDGVPIIFSQKLPTANTTDDLSGKAILAYGDLSQSSMVVTRRPLTIATSLQHSLDGDQVLVRGVTRISVVNHSLGSATVRSPVSALIGTS
jgi:HK97 family phage major capsid protein